MQPKYQLNDTTYVVAPVRQGNHITVEIDGEQVDIVRDKHDAYHQTVTLNGHQQTLHVAQDGDKIFIHFNGKSYQLDRISEFAEAGADGAASDSHIKAPMPGVVLECYVAEGDSVSEGQPLLLIESMKLQTEIVAPNAGVVAQLELESGQSFEKAAVLAAIEVGDE